MSTALPLTRAHRRHMPEPCRDCVFWQHPHAVEDPARKERWTRAMEERHGSWGRILIDGERFRGMVQYGPSRRFPRALRLPAGPPDPEAALISCVYLSDDDPAGACERLLLEALADLKARNVPSVVAFGLRYPEEVPAVERFVGHHTLFDRDFLADLGFSPVRTRGQVALMRIELGGIQPATAVERLARRLRPSLTPAPVPA